MASVALQFIPPDDPDIVKLYILEAPTALGGFVIIETVTSIGTYPDYITEYTTANATSATDWFAIQWEDSKGAKTEISQAIQGGQDTLVGEISRRVRERDPSSDLPIIVQETEAAIQQALGNNIDPYDPTLLSSTTYRQKVGLTYLVMARLQVARFTSTGSIESATLGLVSFKTSSGSTSIEKAVQPLLDMANKELGISTSFVMLIDDSECKTYITYDHSRLVSGWLSIE